MRFPRRFRLRCFGAAPAVAHLRGPGAIGTLRLEGFRSCLLDAGLDADAYLETGGMSEDGGYAAARRLLSRSDRPTAILAFNDMAAIGALSAADDLRLRVPADVSLVGYDNTHLARIRHISLTSVDNGNFPVGAQAGRGRPTGAVVAVLPDAPVFIPAGQRELAATLEKRMGEAKEQ